MPIHSTRTVFWLSCILWIQLIASPLLANDVDTAVLDIDVAMPTSSFRLTFTFNAGTNGGWVPASGRIGNASNYYEGFIGGWGPGFLDVRFDNPDPWGYGSTTFYGSNWTNGVATTFFSEDGYGGVPHYTSPGRIYNGGGSLTRMALRVYPAGSLPADLVTGLSPSKGPCEECGPQQTAAPNTPVKTMDPVRFADGALIMYEDDLDLGQSDGFTFRRSYSNLIGDMDGDLGASWATSAQPKIVYRDGAYMVRLDAHKQHAYYPQGSVFLPVRAGPQKLNANVAGDLVFSDPTGVTMVFHGFGEAIPSRQRGRLMRVYTAGGLPATNSYDSFGRAMQLQRRTVAADQSEVIVFTYDELHGRMTSAERRRITGAAVEVVCRAEYAFNATGTQLSSVIVKDAAGNVLRRFHYRYYTSSGSGGIAGMLQYAVGPRNYARMQQVPIDPETASDALIGQWADKSFQYDSSRRVTQQILRTPDIDGSGVFNYSYTVRPNPPATPGPNDWLMQFVESQPDGSVNTVFTNQAGDMMFRQTATSAGVVQSAEAYRFDNSWRAIWHITPAAMQASGGVWYDAGQTDLLGFSGGNSVFVRDGTGLIKRWSYDATSGQVDSVLHQIGELSAPTLVRRYTYTSHAAP